MSPAASTTTTSLLLTGLRDTDNRAAWEEFDARYRPLIVACARRLGLNADEAADVAQESLLSFVREYREGRYDRQRGRLRAWIIGMARNRVSAAFSARARRRERRGESVLGALPDDAAFEAGWDAERRQLLMRHALAELRETSRTSDRTLRAFELLVFAGRPAADVAAELDMTPHDVYMAKHRVAERLRGIVARLEALYDDDLER
jgi:RNA polymerase sigma-70 factor (ECF subfamily)